MKKIGLLLIATGKYDQYVKLLLESIEKHFFREQEIRVFLFTDKDKIPTSTNRVKVITIQIPHQPWPFPTLYRYKYFTDWSQQIREQQCDMLFYCDVDALFIKDFGQENLLPANSVTKNYLVAVAHCGFSEGGWGSNNVHPESRAYLPITLRRPSYCMGGFQGGTTEEYLSACYQLANNIADDMSRGIMAEWHDESHWNWLLKSNPYNYAIYTLEGGRLFMAEEMEGAREKATILALKKDHEAMRN